MQVIIENEATRRLVTHVLWRQTRDTLSEASDAIYRLEDAILGYPSEADSDAVSDGTTRLESLRRQISAVAAATLGDTVEIDIVSDRFDYLVRDARDGIIEWENLAEQPQEVREVLLDDVDAADQLLKPGSPIRERPRLREVSHDTIGGEHVLGEIFDLIRLRLPHVAVDDPVRPYLARLAPLLCRGLNKPHVMRAPAQPIFAGQR